MVRIRIDNREVDMPEGATVLDAARQLGVDIPALCHHEGLPPNTSCMCCLVRVDGSASLAPSCATPVREGMQVESETEELHAIRRTGLELLLGDHAGDCHAPCENTCPARMDIPDMLRHVADADYHAAIATVKRDIALPAILGRVCPEVCENACRRGLHDSPAAICKLKQFVADRDLRSKQPYRPPVAPASGKRVAIVGGGPTGLTAAYHLGQRGHACTLFEKEAQLGGRLRTQFSREELPQDVLAAESAAALALGAIARISTPLTAKAHSTSVVGSDPETGAALGDEAHNRAARIAGATLDQLLEEFDAVLLAVGRRDSNWLRALGLETTASGVKVDSQTRRTSRHGAFAAGNAVRSYPLVVQSVAEGKLAAECIDCWFAGRVPPDRRATFESRLSRLTAGELCDFCEGSPVTPRVESRLLEAGLTEPLARQEAQRCLECDCSALEVCRLHYYAQLYQCDARRFRGAGRHYEGRIVGDAVELEIGKCIVCGICVQLAERADDAVGLSLVQRSVHLRVAPPPGVSLDQALGGAARQCAEACPTGAISVR